MRVRFAPSPTGALHIGGARTALYNWLLARGQAYGPDGKPGTLVLRIEDTDRERSTPENVEQILDALRWLNLDWDEGPVFQSERAERHREVLEQLLESGHAYHSNATTDDVQAYKERHGVRARVPRRSRGARAPCACTSPTRARRSFDDVIRGQIRFANASMDDFVIARADGSVLYAFANLVDDLDAGDHRRRARRGSHLEHAQAAARPRRARDAAAARTRTCRCSTAPTGASSPSATAPPRSRSCAPPATCRRRSTTTSRCSAPGSPPTRSSSRSTSSRSASGSSASRRTRPCSTSSKLRHLNGRWIRELGDRRAHRAARGVHRPHRPAGRGRDLRGEDPDARRLLAAGRVPVRRAGRRSGGVREGDRP